MRVLLAGDRLLEPAGWFQIPVWGARVVIIVCKGVAMFQKIPDRLDGYSKSQAFAEHQLHICDANDLAAQIEKRAAAVAGVNLGGGLEIKLALDEASLGADDALGDRAFQAQRAA